MTPADILTVPLALVFALLGYAKLVGAAEMPARAEHLGFTTTAYKRIGSLEILAALGLVVGLAAPGVGAAAAVGLLLLLAGAVVTHARNGDGVRHLLPAIVLAGLALAYLGLAAGAVR